MVKNNKIDIFDIGKHISNGDISYYNDITEEERKTFFPVVVMRWLSGSNDKKHINLLNELVNPLVFNLYKHPELIYKAMVVSFNGCKNRIRWINKKKSGGKYSKSVSIIAKYYSCNDRVALDYLNLLSKDDVIQLAEGLGIDSKDIKDIKRELSKK